jgi:hypothetical protein
VKATPALQQFGQLLARRSRAGLVAAVVLAIGNDPAQGFTGPNAMPAPQANLMKTVVEAELGGKPPWDLIFKVRGRRLAGRHAGRAFYACRSRSALYLPSRDAHDDLRRRLRAASWSSGAEGGIRRDRVGRT